MAQAVFYNNRSFNITHDITPATTLITVANAYGLPSPKAGAEYIVGTLVPRSGEGPLEIIHIVAVNDNEFLVERGKEGTSPQTFLFGATLDLRLTAGELNRIYHTKVIYAAAAPFNVTVDDGVDNTQKLSNFVQFLRENRDCIGVLPSGEITVSAQNTKTISGETVRYAMDVSGITLFGSGLGYRGNQGSRLTMQGTPGVVCYQALVDSPNMRCNLTDISVRGDVSEALWLTYSVGSRVTGFYWSGNIKTAIRVGDKRYQAGAMSNIFVGCSGAATTSSALILEGNQWNNGNYFSKCFFTGLEPSIIDCDGGYGAISNSFDGTEFASPDGGSAGLILGNTRGTSFRNAYFESQGPSIVVRPGAISVYLENCTYGTLRNDNAYGVSAFIHREVTGLNRTASIIVNGGWLTSGGGAVYDNLSFISSDEGVGPFIVTIQEMPSNQIQGSGFKYIPTTMLSRITSLRGSFADNDNNMVFNTSAGFEKGSGTTYTRYKVSGREITTTYKLVKQGDTIFTGSGDIRLFGQLPIRFNTTSPDYVGTVVIDFVESGSRIVLEGVCNVTATGSPFTINLRRPSPNTTYGVRQIPFTVDWFNSLPDGTTVTITLTHEN